MNNFREQVIQPGEPGYLPYLGGGLELEKYCPSYSTDKTAGWACTLKNGHTGPHAAHTSDGEQQATWED